MKLKLFAVTKETSYVTAIGSAAIVHQIALACADGAIKACGCGVNNEYSKWNGLVGTGSTTNIVSSTGLWVRGQRRI